MSTFTKKHADRLLKLCNNDAEELSSRAFRFRTFNTTKPPVGHRCGTAGCLLGEAPMVWPRAWRTHCGVPLLKSCKSIDESVKDFFGITEIEALYLFHPSSSRTAPWNTAPLNVTATRKAVVASVKRFIEWKMKRQ